MLCFTPWCKAECATYERTGGCFRCRSQHEDLDLVDVETFYQEAPTDISCPVCSCLQIKQYVVMYCMSCMWSCTILSQGTLVLFWLYYVSCKFHHLYFLPSTRAWQAILRSYRMYTILFFLVIFDTYCRTTGAPLRRLNVVIEHGPIIPC